MTFDSLVLWLESIGPIKAALAATTFTWALTAAGASLVFFFKEMHRKWFDGMLGFTGGVMVAASFWSLRGMVLRRFSRRLSDLVWGLFLFSDWIK